MKLNLGVFLVSILHVVGCTAPASGPIYVEHSSIPSEKALVYVYRPSKNDLTNVCLKILVDDLEKGCLGNQGYLVFELNPGDRKLSMVPNAFMGQELLAFSSNYEKGKVYYVEYNLVPEVADFKNVVASKYVGVMGGNYHVFIEQSADAARTSLVKMRLSM